MFRFPHFLDSRLTDGGEFVNLTRRPHLYPQEDSWYSFLLEAESEGHTKAGRISSIEKSNNFTGNRTPDFRDCSWFIFDIHGILFVCFIFCFSCLIICDTPTPETSCT
jgi:hypothetical protein